MSHRAIGPLKQAMTNADNMTMPEQLRNRTKRFALRVLKMFRALPKTEEARVVGRQILRSGTSVGANYRAVCRARSRREFISKMNVVVEEADETIFWFEILVEGEIVAERKLSALMKEGEELLAIFAASLRTAKSRANRNSNGSLAR
jgi:four helix bundle protein